MCQKRDRGWRRKKEQVKKAHALDLAKNVMHKDPEQQEKIHDHHDLINCSNPNCCGNPRRSKGRVVLTEQEKKNNEAFQAQLQEVDEDLNV